MRETWVSTSRTDHGQRDLLGAHTDHCVAWPSKANHNYPPTANQIFPTTRLSDMTIRPSCQRPPSAKWNRHLTDSSRTGPLFCLQGPSLCREVNCLPEIWQDQLVSFANSPIGRRCEFSQWFSTGDEGSPCIRVASSGVPRREVRLWWSHFTIVVSTFPFPAIIIVYSFWA